MNHYPILLCLALLASCSSTPPRPTPPLQTVSLDEQILSKSKEWAAFATKNQTYYATLPWSGPGRQAWRDLDTETIYLNKMKAFYEAHPTPENGAAYMAEVNSALKRQGLKAE